MILKTTCYFSINTSLNQPCLELTVLFLQKILADNCDLQKFVSVGEPRIKRKIFQNADSRKRCGDIIQISSNQVKLKMVCYVQHRLHQKLMFDVIHQITRIVVPSGFWPDTFIEVREATSETPGFAGLPKA